MRKITRETSEVHFNKRKPREEKEEREESVDGLGFGWITGWGEV